MNPESGAGAAGNQPTGVEPFVPKVAEIPVSEKGRASKKGEVIELRELTQNPLPDLNALSMALAGTSLPIKVDRQGNASADIEKMLPLQGKEEPEARVSIGVDRGSEGTNLIIGFTLGDEKKGTLRSISLSVSSEENRALGTEHVLVALEHGNGMPKKDITDVRRAEGAVKELVKENIEARTSDANPQIPVSQLRSDRDLSSAQEKFSNASTKLERVTQRVEERQAKRDQILLADLTTIVAALESRKKEINRLRLPEAQGGATLTNAEIDRQVHAINALEEFLLMPRDNALRAREDEFAEERKESRNRRKLTVEGRKATKEAFEDPMVMSPEEIQANIELQIANRDLALDDLQFTNESLEFRREMRDSRRDALLNLEEDRRIAQRDLEETRNLIESIGNLSSYTFHRVDRDGALSNVIITPGDIENLNSEELITLLQGNLESIIQSLPEDERQSVQDSMEQLINRIVRETEGMPPVPGPFLSRFKENLTRDTIDIAAETKELDHQIELARIELETAELDLAREEEEIEVIKKEIDRLEQLIKERIFLLEDKLKMAKGIPNTKPDAEIDAIINGLRARASGEGGPNAAPEATPEGEAPAAQNPIPPIEGGAPTPPQTEATPAPTPEAGPAETQENLNTANAAVSGIQAELARHSVEKVTGWQRFKKAAAEVLASFLGGAALRSGVKAVIMGGLALGGVIAAGPMGMLVAAGIGAVGGGLVSGTFSSWLHYKIFKKGVHEAVYLENVNAPKRDAFRNWIFNIARKEYQLEDRVTSLAPVYTQLSAGTLNAQNLTGDQAKQLLAAYKNMRMLQQLTNHEGYTNLGLAEDLFKDKDGKPVAIDAAIDQLAVLLDKAITGGISGGKIKAADLDAVRAETVTEIENLTNRVIWKTTGVKALKGAAIGAIGGVLSNGIQNLIEGRTFTGLPKVHDIINTGPKAETGQSIAEGWQASPTQPLEVAPGALHTVEAHGMITSQEANAWWPGIQAVGRGHNFTGAVWDAAGTPGDHQYALWRAMDMTRNWVSNDDWLKPQTGEAISQLYGRLLVHPDMTNAEAQALLTSIMENDPRSSMEAVLNFNLAEQASTIFPGTVAGVAENAGLTGEVFSGSAAEAASILGGQGIADATSQTMTTFVDTLRGAYFAQNVALLGGAAAIGLGVYDASKYTPFSREAQAEVEAKQKVAEEKKKEKKEKKGKEEEPKDKKTGTPPVAGPERQGQAAEAGQPLAPVGQAPAAAPVVPPTPPEPEGTPSGTSPSGQEPTVLGAPEPGSGNPDASIPFTRAESTRNATKSPSVMVHILPDGTLSTDVKQNQVPGKEALGQVKLSAPDIGTLPLPPAPETVDIDDYVDRQRGAWASIAARVVNLKDVRDASVVRAGVKGLGAADARLSGQMLAGQHDRLGRVLSEMAVEGINELQVGVGKLMLQELGELESYRQMDPMTRGVAGAAGIQIRRVAKWLVGFPDKDEPATPWTDLVLKEMTKEKARVPYTATDEILEIIASVQSITADDKLDADQKRAKIGELLQTHVDQANEAYMLAQGLGVTWLGAKPEQRHLVAKDAPLIHLASIDIAFKALGLDVPVLEAKETGEIEIVPGINLDQLVTTVGNIDPSKGDPALQALLEYMKSRGISIKLTEVTDTATPAAGPVAEQNAAEAIAGTAVASSITSKVAAPGEIVPPEPVAGSGDITKVSARKSPEKAVPGPVDIYRPEVIYRT